ncbi:hypothetical protein FNH05_27365 [Amycolatopsis rhizosphaerae]|uniref:Uncharacterized protein n=1 Tax=Amycolatopsis rhizosphaerae TaxID=2053003 RepID=A0A558B992_9PSEU|nr:hypothetical protein FNH05_27365 [Amycolatopsis rhizosphaerae]
MITPTKGIAPQRALLSIGAQLVQAIDTPVTISQAWNRLLTWRATHNHRAPIPFWWFALALDVLFSMDLVYLEDELLVIRRADVSTPAS